MNSPDPVRELFERSLDLPLAERERFVAEQSGDERVRREVLELLEHHANAGDFLEVPLSRSPLLAPEPAANDRLGPYVLEREIGRGGMGVVYLAREIDDPAAPAVAVKVLLAGMLLSQAGTARFLNEESTGRRLDHPGIVRVLGGGKDRERRYIASEFVDGPTLAQELDPSTRTGVGPSVDDPRALASFFARLARALDHAHQRNVIHRDVKPSNILITSEGHPRLTDLGLARDLSLEGFTRTGDVAGTYAYMSPEQLLGRRDQVDARTDVYSLGVVLYETLTGRRVFDAPSTIELARRVERDDPVPPRRHLPEVPRALDLVCLKALERDPADRFASARAMAEELEAFAAGRPITLRPPSILRRSSRFAKRHRRPLLTGAGVILAATAAALTGWWLQPPVHTLVAITSEPAGAVVHVRHMIPETAEYGPAERLGVTPLEARVEAGFVRFVLVDEQGRFIELHRDVPAPERRGGREKLIVSAKIPADEVRDEAMVEIPAGTYEVGTVEDANDVVSLRAEVRAPAFLIDATEVSVGDYRTFLEATGRDTPNSWAGGDSLLRDALPAAGVSWVDARAYAEWAGKRLPTLREFERAVGGFAHIHAPWPNQSAPAESTRAWACVERIDSSDSAQARGDLATFARNVDDVGSNPRDASSFGVLDLMGSVSEWLESPWRDGLDDGSVRIDGVESTYVGGNWSFPAFLPVQSRGKSGKNGTPAFHLGFRCARSVDPLAIETPVDDGDR